MLCRPARASPAPLRPRDVGPTHAASGRRVHRPELLFADFSRYTPAELERWHIETDTSFGGSCCARRRLAAKSSRPCCGRPRTVATPQALRSAPSRWSAMLCTGNAVRDPSGTSRPRPRVHGPRPAPTAAAVFRGRLVPKPRVLKQSMCSVDLRPQPWRLVEQNALRVLFKSDGLPCVRRLPPSTTCPRSPPALTQTVCRRSPLPGTR